MINFWQIYHLEAERYDQLVSREDQDGNLVAALDSICSLAGIRVLELGAGTGRITRLLSPRVSDITAIDISAHMLEVALKRLAKDTRTEDRDPNYYLVNADNRLLPARNGYADLSIAGWSLGHLVGWYGQTWRQEINKAVAEMRRVTRAGGSIVIIETLGTGRRVPQPPNEALASYYRWLEQEHDFMRRWIRTDYQFESVSEAVELTEFFFGQDLAEKVKVSDSFLLPECTGIWSLYLHS